MLTRLSERNALPHEIEVEPPLCTQACLLLDPLHSTRRPASAGITQPKSGAFRELEIPPVEIKAILGDPIEIEHRWKRFPDLDQRGNAGGTEGPSIASNQTVQITCKLTGFAVADGNTWWYEITSSPWSNAYYVSADAFCNAGTTWVASKVYPSWTSRTELLTYPGRPHHLTRTHSTGGSPDD